VARTICIDLLKQALDHENVVLIEVLDPELFELIHIPGAINIPYENIVQGVQKAFDRDEPLVLYCIDWDCPVSRMAVDKLEKVGYTNVYYYPGGKAEWIEAGLPTIKKIPSKYRKSHHSSV
jgi:rhodanese-related sulfurtransferase